ncbi:MAG: N-6 DNA methylase [Dehalococcoidales bacterium]|nr:N-6 DNA methylase [Dehalococcoidales bacterium]
MPQVQSLDELIARKAIEYADQIKAAAAMADKEEEIRIRSVEQLAYIQRDLDFKLEGKHEFTVASGRVDSVYSRVIIEYKNPKSPGDRIGPKADSPGSKKVVEQIKKRFYDMRHEHGQPLNSLFGVGLDGNHFIFVRFRDEKWQVQEPVEVNRHSAERFLWALFNLGTKGKPFSPEYLAGDFGSEGGNTVAISGIHALYDAIVTTDNPKAQTFFSQWKILFGEVCGYDVDSPSDKIKKLAEFYQVSVKDPKPAELLFAVHTYYALFMKLMAAQIVAFFHKLTTPLERMMQATTSNKLKREMEDLEAGSIFRHLNITNFLEGDLFAWYTGVWTEPIEKLVRDMVTKLDDYNPGTLSEDPTGSRDLLKKLYQQLFPKSVRHDLGEYYTPDWLAEHVLNELGYVGDPDKRLLDPACGSGTFLVMAINRIRKWYEENRERCQFDESELGRKILANVIGFDLNPLAVMAARTNYLIAIRDLVGHMDKVEIPVYLCDSIMTPSEYGGLFAGGLGKARQLKTAPTTFLIPTEIATNRDDVAKYAEQLEAGVRNGYSAEEFIQRCRDEGLPINEQRLHIGLYNELVELDKANKNGVWARIIKNAFAPLFVGKVDFVAGNPPWIFWNNLPEDYREQVRALMTDTYRIAAAKQSTMKNLGAAGKDLSMLFVYVSSDCFLTIGGKLGFVITQTIFQTRAGDEFRRFTLPGGIPLQVDKVEDWMAVRPFRKSAGNKTAVILLTKGKPTIYPIRYISYTANVEFDTEDTALDDVLHKVARADRFAVPSTSNQSNSFWRIIDEKASDDTQTSGIAMESESFKARKGIDTNLESAFRLSLILAKGTGKVLIRNVNKRAKKPLPEIEALVEVDLLFPFVNGQSIKRWGFEIAGTYIVPHTSETGMKPISEPDMRRQFPLTYAFLKNFQKELLSRPLHMRWGPSHPFYSLYNIGPYTFAKYRVAWKRSTKNFTATVLSTCKTPILGERLILGNADVMTIGFDSPEKAYFICGLLNSQPVRERINRAITTKAHRDIIGVVSLPRFDKNNRLHTEISGLSRSLHISVSQGDMETTKLEKQLDLIVNKVLRMRADSN